MVSARRRALERTWRDRCSVLAQRRVTDEETGLTDFEETALCDAVPCRLSFERLSAAGEGCAAAVSQSVKLFLAPEREIPAGCKIVVTRAGEPERKLTFARSGEPAYYGDHQEILLEQFRGYA